MTKPKFTPGPWRIGLIEDGYAYIDAIFIEGTFHARFARVVWQMDDDALIGERSLEQEANARLIATAPELYRELALKDPNNPILAKARGEL